MTSHAQRREHQVGSRTRHPVGDLTHFAQHARVGGDDAPELNRNFFCQYFAMVSSWWRGDFG